MRNVSLVRKETGNSGTFGVLKYENALPYASLEPPWKNNQHNISCIPEGIYKCIGYFSPTYGKVWLVLEVPDRSDILLHVGNYLKDTEGCILIAEERVKDAIYKSRFAFERLRRELEWPSPFMLTITSEGLLEPN